MEKIEPLSEGLDPPSEMLTHESIDVTHEEYEALFSGSKPIRYVHWTQEEFDHIFSMLGYCNV